MPRGPWWRIEASSIPRDMKAHWSFNEHAADRTCGLCSETLLCCTGLCVAHARCSHALLMRVAHAWIYCWLCLYSKLQPIPWGRWQWREHVRARSKTAKKSKQPQLQPKQTHEQRQVSNPKAFGLHRQRKKNCAARASMRVPVEASKRAYSLHSKQKRTKNMRSSGIQIPATCEWKKKGIAPYPFEIRHGAKQKQTKYKPKLKKELLFTLCILPHSVLFSRLFRSSHLHVFLLRMPFFLVFLRSAFFWYCRAHLPVDLLF